MIIECPNCGGQCNAPQEYIGQQVKCPDCENYFEVYNSNLIPCTDCFTPVSKRAVTCPYCGAPLKEEMEKAYGYSSTNANNNDITQEKPIAIYTPAAINYFWIIILGIIFTPVFLIGLFIIIAVIIELKCTTYEMTTHRIIIKRGWISKIRNEIWIKDMRGVNLVQGIWQSAFNIGNIEIGTAADSTEITMVAIKKPNDVIAQINKLRKR